MRSRQHLDGQFIRKPPARVGAAQGNCSALSARPYAYPPDVRGQASTCGCSNTDGGRVAWSLASKAWRIQSRSAIPFLRRGSSHRHPVSQHLAAPLRSGSARHLAIRRHRSHVALGHVAGRRQVGVADQVHDLVEVLVESVLQPCQIVGWTWKRRSCVNSLNRRTTLSCASGPWLGWTPTPAFHSLGNRIWKHSVSGVGSTSAIFLASRILCAPQYACCKSPRRV